MDWYIWIGFGSGEGSGFSINGYFGNNSFRWTIKKPFSIQRWNLEDDILEEWKNSR